MNLTTKYMGLELKGPIVAGASPLGGNVDACKKLEDAGVAAIVMHSLFEEQITHEEEALHHHTASVAHTHPEALSYFPEPADFALGPDAYLEQIRALKEALTIPVMASLNGVTMGGWVRYAKLMQEAGADALELNVYYLANNPEEGPREVEQRYLDVLKAVKEEVKLPVAMKLSPFFSAPLHMAKQLDDAGADGLVLFNRFYQPDIDVDDLEVVTTLRLSTSADLLLRLRWLAATFGRVGCSLAATGGVHQGVDAIKAIMAGANIVQMTSAILQDGPEAAARVLGEMNTWMSEHDYESVEQMRGSMSLQRSPDPAAFERANYMKVLQSWRIARTI